MNIDHIIFLQPISVIWKALGGDAPRRGRACAFYRGGDNPGAISLNDEKACWHDFVSVEGGGVLDLVCRVLECDRTSALQWVANLSGLHLDNRPLTQTERRAYSRRRKQIEQPARDVASNSSFSIVRRKSRHLSSGWKKWGSIRAMSSQASRVDS
jgi:hypothetical protein